MSVSIDLMVAREDEAAAICEDESPLERWEGIDASQHDEITLGNLFTITRGLYAGADRLLECETLVEETEEGPWVLRLPGDFTAAIAALEMRRARQVAEYWRGTDSLQGLSEHDALQFIQQVRRLILRARKARSEVLMRVSI